MLRRDEERRERRGNVREFYGDGEATWCAGRVDLIGEGVRTGGGHCSVWYGMDERKVKRRARYGRYFVKDGGFFVF